MTKVSRYFTLEEYTRSDTAERLCIDNSIYDKKILCNIKNLSVNVMDRVRDLACGPIIITSGYRCFELNYKIRGAPNSDHCYGQAADFRPGYPVDNLQLWLDQMYRFIIDSHIKFHQLIREPNWLHISYRQGNACKYWRQDGIKSKAA